MRLAETCACGAQFSVDDTFHAAPYVYEKLDEWRRLHPCRAGELKEAPREFDALLNVADGLFQMIDRETWRAHGGDDQQGHYEGDYRAAQIEDYLVGLRRSRTAVKAKEWE